MRSLQPGKVSPRYLAEWKRLSDKALAELIISPDRVKDIQKQFPPPQDRVPVKAEDVLFPITLSERQI